MDIKRVFNTLIENIESDYTLECLESGLQETKLLTPSFHSRGFDIRKELIEGISGTDLDDTTGMKSAKISKINLSRIYRDIQVMTNRILYLSLINIGVSLALIIVGFFIIIFAKSQAKLGIIISFSTIFPWLISITAFRYYRNENLKLQGIERDIRKFVKIELFLEMLRYISNEREKTKAYENIIRKIKRKSNPVKKILILSANPEDTDPLRLDKEVREIKEGLRRAKHREQFDIRSEWAISFEDLRGALLDYEPQIVHFSGHGDKDGIVLEGELELAVPISSEVLSELFELCSKHIECVILNACYSEPQAAAINKHINYVIGMPGKINDKAAIKFSRGFYDALGAGKSVEEAFKFGCNAILQSFPDLPDHLIPVLKKGRTE